VVVGNGLVLVLFFMIESKLACVRFISWFNVILGNELVLVLYGKIACASFPSYCNVVVFGNALVLVL
jgi:hypothetical protein